MAKSKASDQPTNETPETQAPVEEKVEVPQVEEKTETVRTDAENIERARALADVNAAKDAETARIEDTTDLRGNDGKEPDER